MPHSVNHVEQSVIKIVFDGDIDKYNLLLLCKQIEAVTLQNIEKGQKLNIIAEVSKMGKVSAEARHLFAAYNKKKRVGRTAVAGFNQAQKILAHFILVESNRNNIYFFDNTNQAEAWLLEKYS